ncbi:MAG: hypothetical protein K1Y36_28070 [Blastocatellia bacterium]|nr:hypothetical protein [Blastocatellia bacterium]
MLASLLVLLIFVVAGGLFLTLVSGRGTGLQETTAPSHTKGDLNQPEQDAQRFARLLVAEIILYNRAKIQTGRTQCNLYSLLRPELDAARATFDQRVAAEIRAERDFLHEEIVTTLAQGDITRLGDAYPVPRPPYPPPPKHSAVD